MSNFLRASWKQKPQMYGPVEAVQKDIRLNAERVGIDPGSIALYLPMWGPGNQVNYGVIPEVGIGYYDSSFVDNSIRFANPADVRTRIEFTNNALKSTGAQTLLSVHRVTGDGKTGTIYTNRGIMGRYVGSGDNRSILLLIDYQTNPTNPKYQLIVSPTGVYATAKSITSNTNIQTNKTRTIVGRFIPNTSLSLFEDGIQKGINTSSISSVVYGGAAPWWISNQYSISGTNYVFQGDVYLSIVFSVALPDSQIALLSDHPYLLLQRNPVRTWFIPSGATLPTPLNLAGSPGLNSITWTWNSGA